MRDQGQSAVEYLMNYGWVILVASVGIIIVSQMIDFTPQYTKRRVAGFSEVRVEDFSFSHTDDKMRLYVRNEAPSRSGIQVTGVTADLDIQGADCATSTPETIAPNQAQLIELACTGLAGNYRPGDYVKAHVTIDYLNLYSGNQHKSTGTLVGYAERESIPTTTT